MSDRPTTLAAPAAAPIPASFWIYLACRFCATTAMRLLGTTVGWHVYQLSESPFLLGLVGLFQFVPALGLTLVGGAVADAYDRRRTMRLAQLPLLVSVTTLYAVTTHGEASVRVLFAVVFANACAVAFDSPARQALVPSLVSLEAFPRAVTYATTVQSLGFAAGPGLAGLAIAAGGPQVSYAVYVLLIAVNWIGLGFVRPVRDSGERRAPSWHAVREGLAFVRSQPIVLGCMTLDMFAVIFGGATALIPVYQRILGISDRAFGLLASSLEIGALTAAFVMVLRPTASRPGRALMIAVAVYGLATIVFGFSRAFPLSVAAYMVAGMADQVSVVMRQTAIQLSTPDPLRGRVSAVNFLFIAASNQLGAMESGFVAAATSPTFAVVSGGIGALLVLAIVAWRIPELRGYRLGTLRS